ncbi:hypothetical protein GCM10010126_70810 [Planomonospora parontospora]|uniref:Uncharacterized protein n=2 Tax=Planomonospora parontospora TaxID=58119 RepID=A0AA37BQ58_9ACTN|nr:hypothetical protein [Planomonospora parontospora]GGL01393.1 hypothetical protein GCM10010126_70810 [Planomonospora parontospora]
MSEASSPESSESRWARRIRFSVQTSMVVLGAALVAGLPFPGLRAWAVSPHGLGTVWKLAILRCVVLAVMLLMLRPLNDPGDVGTGEG